VRQIPLTLQENAVHAKQIAVLLQDFLLGSSNRSKLFTNPH